MLLSFEAESLDRVLRPHQVRAHKGGASEVFGCARIRNETRTFLFSFDVHTRFAALRAQCIPQRLPSQIYSGRNLWHFSIVYVWFLTEIALLSFQSPLSLPHYLIWRGLILHARRTTEA
ncbi:hypothetical protein TWF506_009888 [Arthrobotrys conoides]|uniref:Uncharacterized protein n=1 Tax=Arthrobotrys conoides TaxID=74498 RepID=A0AAN8RLM5_9PEZI